MADGTPAIAAFGVASPTPAPVDEAAFSRQRSMRDWKEEVIQSQRVFLLGVGGVGNTFGMALARMGVAHLSLLDMDVVDASNLNRQILFTRRQVGMRKVDAAAETLRDVHSVRTTLSTHHMNAVTHWHEVVELARASTTIFNGCDYGGFFDYATSSLCKLLGIPYATASTYAFSFQTECFTGDGHGPCWCCNNGPQLLIEPRDVDAALAAESVEALDIDRTLELLRARFRMEHPLLRGMVERALAAATLEADAKADAKSATSEAPAEAAEAPAAAEAAASAAGAVGLTSKLTPLFRRFMTAEILRELRPSRITEHESLAFIPKDPSPSTGAIGSWVGVCATGSLLSVNSWVMAVFGNACVNWSNGSLFAEDSPEFRDNMHWDFFKFCVAPEPTCPVCIEARQLRGIPDRPAPAPAAAEEAAAAPAAAAAEEAAPAPAVAEEAAAPVVEASSEAGAAATTA